MTNEVFIPVCQTEDNCPYLTEFVVQAGLSDGQALQLKNRCTEHNSKNESLGKLCVIADSLFEESELEEEKYMESQ